MSCARRQDCDISSANGDRGSVFAAKHDLCVASGEAEDFVNCGVIVMKVEDAIAPLWRPSVPGKEAFHRTSQIGRSIESTAVKKNRKRVVRHPAVGLEMELFRSYRRIGRGDGASCNSGGYDSAGKLATVDGLCHGV